VLAWFEDALLNALFFDWFEDAWLNALVFDWLAVFAWFVDVPLLDGLAVLVCERLEVEYK
jgi:hypothetical protein